MNKVKYIGYGCLNSQLDKNVIEIKSTKSYKALRAAFLDEIVIEVLPAFTIDRPKLESLVNKYKSFMNNPTEFIIFVVPSVETLGGNLEIAISNYNIIIESFDIIILNRPDLSTCSLSGEVFVDIADEAGIEKLKREFACSQMTQRGRKAISIDERFRKVFWSWQNYFIDTTDAMQLIGCSRATLYSLSHKFMTSDTAYDIYLREYSNLENYMDKPVRGITLDDETCDLLVKLQRSLGDNWTEEGIQTVLEDTPKNIAKFSDCRDYIRLRLNFKYGRAAVFEATKKYLKGREYFDKLKMELECLDIRDLMFKMKF